MISRVTATLLLPMCLLLLGCEGEEPEDIRAWMTESAKNMQGKVPPLPEMKALPAISYEPGEIIQPFATEKLFADELRASAKNGPAKQINTDAHPLAKVPLETVRLLGTLTLGNQIIALVSSGGNVTRQVRVGDYVGQNGGRIIAIRPSTEKSEAEILIRETVQEKASWVERESRISSTGQGEQK